MIAVASQNGSLLRVLPERSAGSYGFHRWFGFVSEREAKHRNDKRIPGRKLTEHGWLFRFSILQSPAGEMEIVPAEGCKAIRNKDKGWTLATAIGEFSLTHQAEIAPGRLGALPDRQSNKKLVALGFVASALLVALLLTLQPTQKEEVPEIIEPVEVKILPQQPKPVVVKAPWDGSVAKTMDQKIAAQKAKRAVEQNLGFLGLIGKKNLKDAVGGMPTSLKDASPGAGPGGKEGSGGEVLVGLGQGVKRTTVGNTGVAGLGGIGTKGAGGGAGGYGTSMIGSGEGKGLSSIALSQDMVLEGGLDRAVIQATIAKYISQVRACYESGLRRNSGLQGQVSVQFEIGPAGGLNYARTSKTTLGDAQVEGCITDRMMGWKFPKPVGGVNVKVNYPFVLRPVNS